ncbi:nuclear localization protein [Histoplasma capsulatum]|uniref:Nuclear localization protein n=1 Tax=Ajellomyces capsulatus TaxID=5037 RepID=A0A8A1M6B0_AJECA|nr:nuclear localization protein [Histoplasma capsulatum]
MNGMGSDLIDGSGTINPAALNTPVPDDHGRRKRGRPPKTPKASSSTNLAPTPAAQRPKSSPSQTQISQLPPQPIPQNTATPAQTSPPAKTTPTKSLVKALPTVRDHTTDQLGEEGDEYIPKEFDENGEKKVDALGYPQDKRKYKCRTFCVPNRGKKLFMLATECARVLGYRDSYLLFNKNRSLYKIIASQAEKDSLIQQDILPYSYRSRQIAIVTARSMFRQFGSRVILEGRRVRDDYWESKARKQGFTEDDMAGEKRPGAAKARDAAAAEAANAGLIPNLGQSDIIYSNGPRIDGIPPDMPPHPASLTPLPMIHLAPADDPRLREFNSIPRRRQEPTGQPFHDRTQPSSGAEIMNQASHTADFSKILNQQRGYRAKGLEEHWNKKRETPVPSQSPVVQVEQTLGVPQSLQSPQMTSGIINANQHPNVLPHTQMMTPQQSYSQPSHQQTSISQSPLRGIPQGMRPDQLQHRSSSISLASPSPSQSSPYPYSQNPQLWGQPPPQPQPSPLSTSHSIGMSQYVPQMHPQQQQQQQQQSPSPHLQNTQPLHPSQSPRHQHRVPPSQLHAQSPSHQQQQQQQQQQQNFAAMSYPGVSAAAYSNMAAARAIYPSSHGMAGSQQYMSAPHQQPSAMSMSMGTSASIPGWPSTTTGGSLQPGGQPQPGSGQSGWPSTY